MAAFPISIPDIAAIGLLTKSHHLYKLPVVSFYANYLVWSAGLNPYWLIESVRAFLHYWWCYRQEVRGANWSSSSQQRILMMTSSLSALRPGRSGQNQNIISFTGDRERPICSLMAKLSLTESN